MKLKMCKALKAKYLKRIYKTSMKYKYYGTLNKSYAKCYVLVFQLARYFNRN